MQLTSIRNWRLILLLALLVTACDAAQNAEHDAADADLPREDAQLEPDAESLRDVEELADADVSSDAGPSVDAVADDGNVGPEDAGPAPDVLVSGDAATPDDSSAPVVIQLQSVRLVLPASAVAQDASLPVLTEATTAAPTNLRAQSPVYAFEPKQTLSAPASLSFTTSEPAAIVYAWSSATARFEPLPTRFVNGVASAEIKELNMVMLGLCPVDLSECNGVCADVSSDESHCGGCDQACASGELCRQGHCASARGETCASALSIEFNENVSPSATLTGDILHGAPDLEVPPNIAERTLLAPSSAPIADRVWSWTATANAHVRLLATLTTGGSFVTARSFLGVYRGGCAPEQLLHVVPLEGTYGSAVEIDVVAGATYYIASFVEVPALRFGETLAAGATLDLSVTFTTSAPVACENLQCSGDCSYSEQPHCGACGNACVAGWCMLGQCECRFNQNSNQTLCGGTCLDLESDPLNCGTCGRACDPGSLCLNGKCLAQGAGLSCATAIELGPNLYWPLRFSMRGPSADQPRPRACEGPNVSPYVRYFKFTAVEAGTSTISANSEAWNHIVLSELSTEQCTDASTPAQCTGEPFGEYSNASLKLNVAKGDVRYFAVSSQLGPIGGRIELTTDTPGIRFPVDPPPDGTICGGRWGLVQRAAEANLGLGSRAPIEFPPPRISARLDTADNHTLEVVVLETVDEWKVVGRKYTPNNDWSQPAEIVRLQKRFGELFQPIVRLAGDPDGVAFVLLYFPARDWGGGRPSEPTFVEYSLSATRYVDGIGWDPPTSMSPDFVEPPPLAAIGRPGGTLGIQVGPTGSASVSYLSRSGRWVRRFIPGLGWQVQQSLGTVGVQGVTIGESATGASLLAFSRQTGSQVAPFYETVTGAWSSGAGSFLNLAPQPPLATMEASGAMWINATGRALFVVPTTDRGPVYSVFENGVWSAPAQIRAVPQPVSDMALKDIDDQAAIAVWSYANLFASCYTPGVGWKPIKLLAEMSTQNLTLLRAGPRSVIARWTSVDEWVARYDW